MFDNQTLYPTPTWLVSRMLADLDIVDKYILEPSAGTGAILTVLSNRLQYRSMKKVYAVEIDPDLCAILREDGFNVTCEDFLTYVPSILFDLIIMNPPFDHAEDHIFHALDIATNTIIVALIPDSILEGKNAQERLLLQIIEDMGGTVESVGQPFKTGAERRTDVHCSILRLTKKVAEWNGIKFDVHNTFDRNGGFGEAPNFKELSLPGFVDNLLAASAAAVGAYGGYINARMDCERYVSLFQRLYGPGLSLIDDADKGITAQDRYNNLVALVNEAAWNKLFDHPGLQAILTESARKMMTKFRQEHLAVDFNRENVTAMINAVEGMARELLDKALIDVFDHFTKYHAENRYCEEGWKSNSCWFVTRRVVLPYSVEIFLRHFQVNYGSRDGLDDIDRVMCMLTGKKYDSVARITQVLADVFRNGYTSGEWVETEFFMVRAYMKGTLHLKFKEDWLWETFNYEASKAKKWLGNGIVWTRSKPSKGRPVQETML